SYAVGSCPFSVSEGDFNGDGKSDVVTANECSGTVSVLLGNGDGSFQAQQAYATGSSPYALAVGDLNGDGKPDIAVTSLSGTNTVSVLLNQWSVQATASNVLVLGGPAIHAVFAAYGGEAN